MTQPPADRLSLLYRVSQTFNSSLDLDDVLTRVMDEVVAVTRAERGFLMLYDDNRKLDFRAARGMDHQTINAPEFQISRGLVERVAAEGQPQLAGDAQGEGWLSLRSSVANLQLRSILCVPLKLKDKTLGVVYVDNRMQAGLFTPDDLDLLTTIAASAAVAIENARLYQLAVEKGRMERELQMALEVQSSLIPQETPQIDGWDFAAIWRPARVVGGDYYDFIPIAGTPAPQHGILIADVSDKGMAAALFMALTRSTVRASLLPGHTPAECITQANRLISADAAHGMFVTCFYAQLDPGKGELVYVNAGHNPPLVYSAAQNRLSELTRTGAALGMIDDQIYGQRTILLSRGDFILLYTDGISEAMNTAQEQFGTDRLERTVLANRDAASAEIIAAVERAVNDFIGSAAVFDDITALVVKRI